MPGALSGFLGGGSKSSPTNAPQPTALTINTPGYGIASSVGPNGQIQTNLNTGGSFGQNAYQTYFPQFLSQYGGLGSQAGNAGSQYLSDIGYSTTGAPSPNAPFLSPLQAIENARQSAMSNLQDSLARRGVIGSSFGADALTQQDLAYQNLKAQTQNQIAASVMQSKFAALDQQAQFIGAQTALIQSSLQKEFNDWTAANGINGNFASITGNLSAFDQLLAANQAAGLGSFFGNSLGMTNGGLANIIGLPTSPNSVTGGSTLSGGSGGGGLFGSLGSLFGSAPAGQATGSVLDNSGALSGLTSGFGSGAGGAALSDAGFLYG